MSLICIEIFKGFITFTAVAAGSLIGLQIYFRQKEYELVKQRYLEGAIDVVTAQIEDSLGVVQHNYTRSLHLCKSLRETESSFDINELQRGYLELDLSKFHRIAHHRLGILLDSQVVWEVFQSAMAYASTANAIISYETPEAIRIHCNKILTMDLTKEDYKTVANKLESIITKQHKDSYKYSVLIGELNKLMRMLEAEKLNLKAIGEFNQRQEVKQIVERLKQSFREELESN